MLGVLNEERRPSDVVYSNLNKFEQFRTSLNNSRQVWTSLAIVWAHSTVLGVLNEERRPSDVGGRLTNKLASSAQQV